MKVKQAAGDFVVEEVLARPVEPAGPFTLYLLRQRGLGTQAAVRALARAWRLRPADCSFAGLKDRWGDTVQWLAIRRGPPRTHHEPGFEVEPRGYTGRPLGRSDVDRNRFRLVLRDLSEREAQRARERAAEVGAFGFANYYDDQRFGSMRATPGRLVFGAWLRGDAEGALRLAIAAPGAQDRSRLKARRRLLAERWGAWAELAARLDPSPERRLCGALAAGAGFAAAYGMLDAHLRALHAGAWQAWVFNAGLRRAIGPGPSAPGIGQRYVFYPGPAGALSDLAIPLAAPGAEAHPLLDEALAAEGVDRTRLAGTPLRRGLRPAVARAEGLEVSGVEKDARNPGRRALRLAFALGRGSFATMLLKRLTHDARRR